MDEIPVRFRSGENALYGILGLPDGTPRGGVVLVHGWTGCRMGPHRILVESARHLNALGFAALRFDLSGRGESEGNPFATDLDGMIADTCAALEAIRSRLPHAAPVALWGMCSGGNVALGALHFAPEVSAVVCWSTYPFQSQRGRGQDLKRTGHFLADYSRKLLRLSTWKRLLRGAVNVRMVLRVLFGHLRGAPRDFDRSPQESARDRELVEAIGRYRGRLLFLFGGADPEAADARRMFREFCAECGVAADFEEIPGANHNFYSLHWKRLAIERSAGWLEGAVSRCNN